MLNCPLRSLCCACTASLLLAVCEHDWRPLLKPTVSETIKCLVYTPPAHNLSSCSVLPCFLSTQVAAHDAPVRHVAYSPHLNMLITGSWDKTVRYWDCRSPVAAHVTTLQERVYAMDLQSPCLVVGTADRNLIVYDITKPQSPLKTVQSQLKFQTRCVSVFPDKTGFLVGSIEGRVAVAHMDDTVGTTKNFTFKCHRDVPAAPAPSDIFAVNSINFHPGFGTFATAGSDGSYNFWDKDSKQRLKAQARSMYGPGVGAPITAAGFSRDGALYGYAISYDWSRGYAEYNPANMKSYILLHVCKEDEVKAKPPKAAVAGARK